MMTMKKAKVSFNDAPGALGRIGFPKGTLDRHVVLHGEESWNEEQNWKVRHSIMGLLFSGRKKEEQ